MYKLSDISVIMPTYNRANEVQETLKSLAPLSKDLLEVIISDQSKNNETREIIRKLNNKKIKYLYSETPSITIARNLGVKYLSLKTRIVCFLDDDVTLHKSYFKEILKIFNQYPNAMASAGVDDSSYWNEKKKSLIHYVVKKIFFLGHYEMNKARIISAYGNTYAKNLRKVITAEWIPGVNMCYKREVFDEQRFDSNLLGYTVAEDIDFSYRLFKKCPESIFITPRAILKHRASQVERQPTKRLAYINQVDHFYFNFKNLNRTVKEKLIFAWSLLGISLLRVFEFVMLPNKNNKLKLNYFAESLVYCLKNLAIIRAGRVREFDKSI